MKPANVVSALDAVQPYAVDVSSGLESEPGIKNADLMRAFFAEVVRFAAGQREDPRV